MTYKCQHCGSVVEHPGVCPTIKAIEYFKGAGGIKRVEYKCVADYGPQRSFPAPLGPAAPFGAAQLNPNVLSYTIGPDGVMRPA